MRSCALLNSHHSESRLTIVRTLEHLVTNRYWSHLDLYANLEPLLATWSGTLVQDNVFQLALGTHRTESPISRTQTSIQSKVVMPSKQHCILQLQCFRPSSAAARVLVLSDVTPGGPAGDLPHAKQQLPTISDPARIRLKSCTDGGWGVASLLIRTNGIMGARQLIVQRGCSPTEKVLRHTYPDSAVIPKCALKKTGSGAWCPDDFAVELF